MEKMLKCARLLNRLSNTKCLFSSCLDRSNVLNLIRPAMVPAISFGRGYSSEVQLETTKINRQDGEITKKVIGMVNDIIDKKNEGRLFAVIQVCGKQFKITNNDLILVEGYWPPDIGDEIRLEKVLLVGSADFTLVGRPLLPLNQVSVKATIIEKSMTHTRTRFKYVKRKQYKRIQFQKEQLTCIRINSIDILNRVDDLGDVDGNIDRIF